MAGKRKLAGSAAEKPLPSVAAMKFWSRFKHPPPMLAFAFPEAPESEPASLNVLMRLPSVPVDDSVVYSLRISLDGAKPPIWRRVLVKSLSLDVLHYVIQLVMGWQDSHLHEFEVRRTRVPLMDEGTSIDEGAISIAQLYTAKIKKIYYTYDLGDDWRHTITIENSVPVQSDAKYPQCLDGKGTCPVEDIGGIDRWLELLEAIRHPENERDLEIDELMDRLGKDFIPTSFDLKETNKLLRRVFNFRARRTGNAQRSS